MRGKLSLVFGRYMGTFLHNRNLFNRCVRLIRLDLFCNSTIFDYRRYHLKGKQLSRDYVQGLLRSQVPDEIYKRMGVTIRQEKTKNLSRLWKVYVTRLFGHAYFWLKW